MPQTETQRIHIFKKKISTSFVRLFSKKSQDANLELFLISEIPILNPAAFDDTEKFFESLENTCQEIFFHPFGPSSFENLLSSLNTQLAGLHANGKGHWLTKLSSILAVKYRRMLYIANNGKVQGILLNQDGPTAIAESTTTEHPLKFFDSFSVGKLKEGDTVILSTNQLYSYVSIDRLAKFFADTNSLTDAVVRLTEVLDKDAGTEDSFGAFFLRQPPLEQNSPLPSLSTKEQQQPVLSQPVRHQNSSLIPDIKLPELPSLKLPDKKTVYKRLVDMIFSLNALIPLGKKRPTVLPGAEVIPPKMVIQASLETKRDHNIFTQTTALLKTHFKLTIVCLVGLVAMIGVTVYINHYISVNQEKKAAAEKLTRDISNTKKALDQAESSLLYNTPEAAQTPLATASNILSGYQSSDVEDIKKLQERFASLKKRANKTDSAQAQLLANLSPGATTLLSFNGSFATGGLSQIQSFNLKTKQVENVFSSNQQIGLQAALENNNIIVNASGYYSWNPQSGNTIGPLKGFTTLPLSMKFYKTNGKLYILTQDSGKIVSVSVSSSGFTSPNLSLTLNQHAQDFAVDGSIYILTDHGIEKYLRGSKGDLGEAEKIKDFSGSGKIFTNENTVRIYLLDSKNHSLSVYSKEGSKIKVISLENLSNPTDFSISEKDGKAYILDAGNLYEVSL